MPKSRVLIVDDNKSIVTALEILLIPEFDHVRGITNPNLILTELRNCNYNLVILDMNFKAGNNSGNEGLYWLGRILETNPEISVVLITAYKDVEVAVEALKRGATDFILKPWENSKLLATLKTAVQLSHSRQEVMQLKQKESFLKQEINKTQPVIMGNSPKLMQVLNIVRKVARTNANILITGENGTGKELIAKEIHRLSERNNELLVNVDMGAVSESLFESELFGHVKGAFTDARENRAGKFETANRGTLFLDEIGNLSLHLQAKLLSALQNREVMRVGSDRPIAVDIRPISATNKNLQQMVSDGVFREDLLYRINTIQIEVPPLRERGEDIILLAEYFIRKYASKYEKANLKINSNAREKLLKYPWPGNVRELDHTIEKAVILSDSSILKPEDFFLQQTSLFRPDETASSLEEMEKHFIRSVMQKNNGNLSATAGQLGVTRQTLYNKIKKYGL